jgi:hypothetical protein
MTYQELVNRIRDLGFSDDAEMEDFGELVPNAINLAITTIGLEVAPQLEKYEFTIEDSDSGYLYITMPNIDNNFLEFGDTPVVYAVGNDEVYQKFSDFDIEMDNTVVINADDNKGSFRIFYKISHAPFTGDASQMETELPLPLKVHHLVPLLAAYYVWLEDEPTKAAQYLNDYEQKSAVIYSQSLSNRIRMRVLSGGI